MLLLAPTLVPWTLSLDPPQQLFLTTALQILPYNAIPLYQRSTKSLPVAAERYQSVRGMFEQCWTESAAAGRNAAPH
jgi:hypothetical protein